MSDSRSMILVVVILLAVALLFLGSLVPGVKQGKMSKSLPFKSEYQTALDSKKLPTELRQEFPKKNNDNDIALSENVKVSILTKGSHWWIKDDDKGINYIVLKEDDSLNIYSLEAPWVKVLDVLLY